MTINTRRITSNAPSIFDDLFSGTFLNNPQQSYPPYNLIKTDEGYQVQVATNGADKKNLDVFVRGGFLHIVHNAPSDREDGITFLHKGIPTRSFELKFSIRENSGVEITSAKVEDGILNVFLKAVEDVKRIEIL